MCNLTYIQYYFVFGLIHKEDNSRNYNFILLNANQLHTPLYTMQIHSLANMVTLKKVYTIIH